METNKLLKQMRSDFTKASLDENDVNQDPFMQFNSWLAEAVKSEVLEPIATTLSTVSRYGYPSSRVVYIRDITPNGFVFFTNYLSKKGHDLEQNPKACMNIFWPELERQIRLEGLIEKVTEEVSDAYFNDRPKSSQIGAWASAQSEEIANRSQLEEKVKELTIFYQDKPVERPQNWGGYILVPHYFEFWQGRSSRLHDRLAFKKDENDWKITRLNP